MNTKIFMTSSALILGLAGVILNFVPDIVLEHFQLEKSATSQVFLQISGAMYIGLAMLNWMSKGGLIGGIYNHPIAMANFTHFMIASLALIKHLKNATASTPSLWIIAVIYTVFAVVFGLILFRHPSKGA